MFRAEAPGRTIREFRISRPTLEMDSVTTTAMATMNSVWLSPTGMPREEASWGWMAVRVSRLAQSAQKIMTASSTSASIPISPGVTERMSPMRYLLYLVKLPPPMVATKMPRATAVLENTPISVSAA